jgi:hypothetical protein
MRISVFHRLPVMYSMRLEHTFRMPEKGVVAFYFFRRFVKASYNLSSDTASFNREETGNKTGTDK